MDKACDRGVCLSNNWCGQNQQTCLKEGALDYVRNHKTVQKHNRNHKTEINFIQNWKPQANSEKICTRFRLLSSHIFQRETRKIPKGWEYLKMQFYFCWKPETENQIEHKLQTATDIRTKNLKFFGGKIKKKNNLKNGWNNKTEIPNTHLKYK